MGNFGGVSRNASRQVGNYVQYMSFCIFHFFFVKFILFALIMLCVT